MTVVWCTGNIETNEQITQRMIDEDAAYTQSIAEASYLWVDFQVTWADEFTLRGAQIMTKQEWDELFLLIVGGSYPYSESFGSNQRNTWHDAASLLGDFEPKAITEQQYRAIMDVTRGLPVGYWPNLEM